MADQSIKSRPIHNPIGLDATGTRHLLIVDGAQVPSDALRTELGPFPEVWTVARDERSEDPHSETRAFGSLALMLGALKLRLARETMGFRLYAIGSETFLADVKLLGIAAGLGRAEMALAQSGSLARRVYCVHCRSLTEGASTNVIGCSGCGASLVVRDHFSPRLAAFMGVQADAEEPGVLPAIKALYP